MEKTGLIVCHDCEKQFSIRASKCPNCHGPNRVNKRILFWSLFRHPLLLIFVSGVVFSGFFKCIESSKQGELDKREAGSTIIREGRKLLNNNLNIYKTKLELNQRITKLRKLGMSDEEIFKDQEMVRLTEKDNKFYFESMQDYSMQQILLLVEVYFSTEAKNQWIHLSKTNEEMSKVHLENDQKKMQQGIDNFTKYAQKFNRELDRGIALIFFELLE